MTKNIVDPERAAAILEDHSVINRVMSFRNMLREDTEVNQLFINANQESFKNLINPDVTRHKYTIMNSNPSQKSFFFGIAQNGQNVKQRGAEQLATVTNKFLNSAINPPPPAQK